MQAAGVLSQYPMTATESLIHPTGNVRRESRAAVASENWKLLQLFNFYRLLLGGLAAFVALVFGQMPPFGTVSPNLFLYAGLAYFAIGLAAAWTIRVHKPDFESQAVMLGFADVALLTMLLHASGGIGSGAELMLLVSIAGSSLMLGRRITVFYASIATLAVLIEHAWGILTNTASSEGEVLQGYPKAGLLGVGLFATALVGYTLAERLRRTEALAEKRGVDLANLAQMNELIIQRLQSGVVVCGPDGRIRLINPIAHKFLGTPPTAVQNLTLNDVLPDMAIQYVQWQTTHAPPSLRKLVRSRKNFTLLPRFIPLGDEPSAGTLIFLDDMSVLKQQAQQLKMAALARLTASIAHEIRNPLGALSNAAQLLSEVRIDDPELTRLLKIIDEQSRRMNIIVENVTQLSRRDRVNPRRLDLDTWLNEFTRQYTETVLIPKESFAPPVRSGLAGCFDPEQLYQVVSNLCQNALRASPPFTGTPQIQLRLARDGDGRPYLDVIDWGKGVPPDNVDNIFDPFFTTTPKGTGLGLYIARELCEGNNGALDYRPGEGGVGSVFRVTFSPGEDCSDAAES